MTTRLRTAERDPRRHRCMMCAVLRAHGVTNKGQIRATNEDYFVIDEPPYDAGCSIASCGSVARRASDARCALRRTRNNSGACTVSVGAGSVVGATTTGPMKVVPGAGLDGEAGELRSTV